MEAALSYTMVSAVLGVVASVALVGMTAAVMYLSYWWALHYGFISLNENGKVSLKSKNLPPGSMGLPSIGQSLVWKKNPELFYESRFKR